MKIDPYTGKVYYEHYTSPIITDNLKIEEPTLRIEEPVFSKTVHQNLKYGRLKFMFYCFLLMMDGLVGVISLGQTQSIMANKYLLSDYVMGDYDADRQNSR